MSSQSTAAIAAPHTFLALAPTTSASYPSTPLRTPPKSPEQSPISETPSAESIDELLLKTRRSSSLDSTGSSKHRFLKLGPVHFGVGEGDWSENALAE